MKCPSCGSEIPEGSKECFVCGEILGATQSETYNKMYSTPAASASNDISRDVVTVKKSSRANAIIGILIALVCIAVAFFYVSSKGIFTDHSGTYDSNNLREAITNYMDAQFAGQPGYSSNQINAGASLVVDKDKYTLTIKMYYGGEETSNETVTGTIHFWGDAGYITYDNQGNDKYQMKYDKDTQTIHFPLNDKAKKEFSVEYLEFIKSN